MIVSITAPSGTVYLNASAARAALALQALESPGLGPTFAQNVPQRCDASCSLVHSELPSARTRQPRGQIRGTTVPIRLYGSTRVRTAGPSHGDSSEAGARGAERGDSRYPRGTSFSRYLLFRVERACYFLFTTFGVSLS